MGTLEDAIQIAAEAHKGQPDKAGAPYILHPLRMMMRMKSESEMITAILHDVVEDTDWTIEKLRKKGFSEEVWNVNCSRHAIRNTRSTWSGSISEREFRTEATKDESSSPSRVKKFPPRNNK